MCEVFARSLCSRSRVSCTLTPSLSTYRMITDLLNTSLTCSLRVTEPWKLNTASRLTKITNTSDSVDLCYICRLLLGIGKVASSLYKVHRTHDVASIGLRKCWTDIPVVGTWLYVNCKWNRTLHRLNVGVSISDSSPEGFGL